MPSLKLAPTRPPGGLGAVWSRGVAEAQAPGVRRMLAVATVVGRCYNGREMLFGPSAMRARLTDSARVLVADVPDAAADMARVATAADTLLSGRGLAGFPERFASFCFWTKAW